MSSDSTRTPDSYESPHPSLDGIWEEPWSEFGRCDWCSDCKGVHSYSHNHRSDPSVRNYDEEEAVASKVEEQAVESKETVVVEDSDGEIVQDSYESE